MEKVIPPGFNEEEFQTIINMFYLRFLKRYKLFDFHIPTRIDEKNLGFDFKGRSAVPFFFQYKVSNFYTPKTSSSLKKDREKYKYDDIYGFYSFKLHRDNFTNKHIQHNLLYNLGYFNFYVAPKFYERSDLYDFMINILNNTISIINPYRYEFNDDPIFFYNRKHLEFLEDCIYIKPHARINDTISHKYSFNLINQTMYHSDPIEINTSVYNIIKILTDKIQHYNDYKINFTKISESIYKAIKNTDDNNLKLLTESYIDFAEDFELEKQEMENSENLMNYLSEKNISYPLIYLRRFLKKYFNISLYLLEKYDFI